MNQADDFLIRQQALDTQCSFAVSAPAGSGKTGLLTQRVLALLGECEQPENILAITFTKKAAAEMQHRIFAALLKTQQQLDNNEGPPTNDYELKTWQLAKKVLLRNEEKQWQLLSLPKRLQITTIDSFCRLLGQQMPLANGMGTVPEMLDSASADHAYLLAARETLALIESQHDISKDLSRLVKHFNNQLGTIEELLIKLLKRRDQWLSYLYSAKDQRNLLESSLGLVINHHLSLLQEQILPFSGELLTLADYAANNLNQDNSESIICSCLGIVSLPGKYHSDLKEWAALAELLLTKEGSPRKRVNKTQGFPAVDKKASKEEQDFCKQQKQRIEALLKELGEHPELIKTLHLSRYLPDTGYSDEQWQLLDSLTRVLALLVAQLTIIFQQLGKTDFISVTLAALNALGEEDQPTDIALALDYRIQHILVDEFQDTSTPQLALLKKLSAGWQTGDGRTLFVVGDAMQSCYGFRDANVGIFLDIREQGISDIELIPLDLSVNFRSQQTIVDWCNTVFSAVFPQQNQINQGAVKYQNAIAFNPPEPDSGIQTHLLTSEEKLSDRQEEAKLIVKLIQEQQQKECDAQTKSHNSIAILVRKRSQVNEITQALNNAQISYRATELDKLDTNILVMDLLNLTRALLYPNDRIAWLSLLRAPWCGLDMFDLYHLANTKINNTKPQLTTLLFKHLDKVSLSASGTAVLNRFKDNISIINANQGRQDLRNWIESAWLQLGGDALLISSEEKYAVNAFFQCLEKHQQGGGLSNWSVFVGAISQLYNKSIATDIVNNATDAASIPPVEIMTIHKSKGLEFDTVIIPGLDLLANSDKQELLVWLEWLDAEQQSRLLISPVHATGNENDTIYTYIRSQQKQKQELEANRLFYVGCTRAIKQLHLLGHCLTKKNEVIKPNNNSALNNLWDHISETATTYSIEPNTLNANEYALSGKQTNQHPNKIIRLDSDWQAPLYIKNDLLKKYRLKHASSEQDNNLASPSELLQRNQRYFGQVLHSALELITQTGLENWNTQRIQEQHAFWKKQFLQLGLSDKLSQQYLEKLSSALERVFSSQTGRWLLSSEHEDSQCELALWSADKSVIKELVIDRTFICRKDNTRWIIDYKSSEPLTDQPIEDFTHAEGESYRQQLLAYKHLFEKQEQPIRCALYFPLIDILYEIKH